MESSREYSHPPVIPESLRDDFHTIGEIRGILIRIRDRNLEKLANDFKILSDRNRLTILLSLRIIPCCACMLKEITGLHDSQLSYHINQLKNAHLIKGKKEKNWIIYSLTRTGREMTLLLDR